VRPPYREDADPDGLRAPTSPFARIRSASPCEASWEKMIPPRGTEEIAGDKVRRCAECGRNLYNLSAMTEAESLRLITLLERVPLERLYRRTDGSVLTADCPVGLRAQLRSACVAALIVVAATVTAAALLGGC
jgi:hypothetical protein